MRFRFPIVALAALHLTCSAAIAANNFVVKDGNAATVTKCSVQQSDGSQADCNILLDSSGLKIDPATKQLQQQFLTALGSPFQAGGSIANTTFGAKLQDATGAAFGTVGNPINVTGIGGGSVPTGTAGAPNAAVMSVQGVAGGTGVPITATTLPLPTGAASAALQTTGNTSLASLAGTVGAAGSPSANAQTVQAPSTGFTVTTTLPQISATDIGGSFGTTATQLAGALATRRFVQLQVQGTPDSTGAHGCYINGSATATADYHSLFIPRGSYFESGTHVGTAAISIICTDAATSVYGRQG